ncbi:cox cluster protein [Salinirubellus salinus]|uniref:Cox cluster protein n=1 Tax=Salinirubellus salinus TaxID=1364945 RepID=A0A9E7R4E9_9EURY|nr:cox cluster protein [Salinirubellus salinus]UWM55286.1 cox cluster protein [Salinirubellus salinus]
MEQRADTDTGGGVETPKKMSPWPLFVAVGLAVAEVGIVMEGLYPVAVAGLLLFVGSVAGIVHEAGYVARPWKLLGALGALLVLAGVGVLYSQVGTDLLSALASDSVVVVRGYAILGAGVIAVFGGFAGRFVVDADPSVPE